MFGARRLYGPKRWPHLGRPQSYDLTTLYMCPTTDPMEVCDRWVFHTKEPDSQDIEAV